MLDNPLKLSVPLLKEANYPTWRPAMEARLREFGVFCIVTGKTQELSPPGLIPPMQDAQDNNEPLPQTALILIGQMTLAYQKQLSVYHERKEKAAGNIPSHLSCWQQTHVKDKGSDAKGIWNDLKLVHVQQVPGMHFLAYNKLFSVAKGADKMLSAVDLRVEEVLACVKKLCPANVRLAVGTRPYELADLDNKLALRVMLHALPCGEYGDFTSPLMRTKDPTRVGFEATFQVKQTKRNTHCGPLLSPSADAALRTNTTGPPRQDKLGVKRGFGTGKKHNGDACYKKDCVRKYTQQAVEKRCGTRGSAKPHRANRATASLLPALSDSMKVVELAASASVRLAGSPNMHADAH
jgi:hypothetical protein